MPEVSTRGNTAMETSPEPQTQPPVYSFRLDQYRVANTRSLETDSNTIGYTVTVGQQSYTQTLPPQDVGDGNHDVGLEFPNITIPDATTGVSLAFAIVNAGHNASQVEAALQQGVNQFITSAAKGGSGGSGGPGAGAAAAATAAAGAAGASFGVLAVVAAVTLVTDLGLSLMFADCDGTVAADKISPTRAQLDALFPSGGCVATQTAFYPGTGSPDGCGANSQYYVTQTITRAARGSVNTPQAGKQFIVANRSSGLVLDVPGGASTPNLQIHQWPDNGTLSQHWELQQVDNGYFMIRSALNGLVLEVAGNSMSDHAAITQAPATSAPNQQWRFEPVSFPSNLELQVLGAATPFFKIRSRSSGKVFDVAGFSASQGVKMQQYEDKSSDFGNQSWQLLEVPSTGNSTVGHLENA